MSLTPISFTTLVRRLAAELAQADGTVFELPLRKIWRGTPGLDLSVRHHGRRAATPLGPAAGPHTQLAQNLVVAWLAGCRIMELKTVQVRDDLVIPRPCIDMATVGYNVEWSQELRLEDSATEYVKASMLVDMLRQARLVDLPEGDGDTLFDTSVGYDLAGIQSAPVQRFLDTLRDASAVIARLRAEIPAALAHLRDVDFTRHISGSLTLSTFHGCPPGEIEAIARWLMEVRGLDVVVKLNPTLLGRARVRHVLHDVLGYADVHVPDTAFDADATWDDAVGIVGRLQERACQLGRGFGIKLTNTLVVANHRDFFPPSEKVMYLSGAPLHVLAVELVERFRNHFGAALPISFSAGVDRHNFPDTVALGLVPVTVCSDLLQPGGYARAAGYLGDLAARMHAVAAPDIATFVRRAFDPGFAGEPVANARAHAVAALADPRYTQAKNARAPKKLARTLATFDCTACDKCLPVCPNTAIFRVALAHPPHTIDQIAILADACNDCGNCDVFCPEHGGPNLAKPRFHTTRAGWEHAAPRDGILVERTAAGLVAHGRLGGRALSVALDDATPAETPLHADLRALAVAATARGTHNWIAVHTESTPS